jgi:hypothetical protein
MKVSALAGKPAVAAMVVDVPRLVPAYYVDRPDPSVLEERVTAKLGRKPYEVPVGFKWFGLRLDRGAIHAQA